MVLLEEPDPMALLVHAAKLVFVGILEARRVLQVQTE